MGTEKQGTAMEQRVAWGVLLILLAATLVLAWLVPGRVSTWSWLVVAPIVVGTTVLVSASVWNVGKRTLHVLDRVGLRSSHAAGNLSAPVPGAAPDPVGKIEQALLGFRKRLAETVNTRRSARRQAEEADRYETEFLRSLSHELRTPLNAIVGFSEVLLEEIDGPIDAGQREDLETVLASGQQLTELVDDVLDLAAMQSGRVQLTRVPTDLRPIVDEVAALLEGQRRGRDVRVEKITPTEAMMVLGDEKRLRQIIMNLGSNAVKFTESGFVRLRVEGDATSIRVAVEDTGPGIGPEDLKRIFEEFAQVGDLRRKGQGSGLGLAICKRLTAMHEGRISVESVVGQGSIFCVHLERCWET